MNEKYLKIKIIGLEELFQLQRTKRIKQIGQSKTITNEDLEDLEIACGIPSPIFAGKKTEELEETLKRVESNEKIPRKRNGDYPDYIFYQTTIPLREKTNFSIYPTTTHPLVAYSLAYTKWKNSKTHVTFYEKIKPKTKK